MKILVRNFQSLSLAELEVEGLTVVIGPSDIGKSALIRAVSAAFFGLAGDDFIRHGSTETTVEVIGAPKVNGGTIDVTWSKGKGINKFVIDGHTYDKVGRETPVHIQAAGYKDIVINDEDIRPQVADQFFDGNLFLLKRSGSFVHDVIAQASRLSILLRADKNCSTDLKRQRAEQRIRQSDLEIAKERLEKMSPIKEFHSRIQAIKAKFTSLKQLSSRLTSLRTTAETRHILIPLLDLKLPETIHLPDVLFQKAEKIQELIALATERKLYLKLPDLPPSSKPIDFDGLSKMSSDMVLADTLAQERKLVTKEVYDATASLKSIIQDGDMVKAELEEALASISICPVCERPMEIQGAEVHSHQ